MTRTTHGKVHGRTIELDEDLGVAEGQEVEVQVKVIPRVTRTPGEGFLRTEGALADDPEWDSIMDVSDHFVGYHYFSERVPPVTQAWHILVDTNALSTK
jgi:hypothetical protein